MSHLTLLSTNLSDLFLSASLSGRLSQTDCSGLMAALEDEYINEEQKDIVSRILYGVNRGWIATVE